MQKVGSEFSSTTKGRNQVTRKENWITRDMNQAKLGSSKGHQSGIRHLVKMKKMPGLIPREDYNKLTIKRLKEVVKERAIGTMGLSKLKMQELSNIIERGCN